MVRIWTVAVTENVLEETGHYDSLIWIVIASGEDARVALAQGAHNRQIDIGTRAAAASASRLHLLAQQPLIKDSDRGHVP